MEKIRSLLQNIQSSPANHLPIVAAFCKRAGLVDAINRVVPSNMEVDIGTIVQAMVLDILSSRSPLYRLADFFRCLDTELLMGRPQMWGALNDTTVGRAMDQIFSVGAEKMFNSVAFQTAVRFPLDMHVGHFDTTSVSVWGAYDVCRAGGKKLNITYGHSKDHRPDLKQFLIKMLCVGRNIPIIGGCENGNASDKNLNSALLSRISEHMRRYGIFPGDFLYVADAAMVTEENLRLLGDNPFVTRLPFSYSEASRVVKEAVAQGRWEETGTLNETPGTPKRPVAHYSITEKIVTLYEREYRAVVVHSTAHDKRRLKRIDREIQKSVKALHKLIVEESKRKYFCRPDAEAAACRLQQSDTDLHQITTCLNEKLLYARGRPSKNAPRKVSAVHYFLAAQIEEKAEQIQCRREEAGCFVLLTNVPRQGDKSRSGAELLRLYKDQYGIERNYSFLKDPLIVNDLFLKKPERVEVLGAILLIALLIWNLIEHVLRQHVDKGNVDLPGWDNKPTRRPTAFMMSTKFLGLQVIKVHSSYHLLKPLTNEQKLYLEALDISEQDLLFPLREIGCN